MSQGEEDELHKVRKSLSDEMMTEMNTTED